MKHGFYQIDFDPTRPKQSIFETNQIFAYPSPDLQVITCDEPSQTEERIGNGPWVLEDLSGKLIPVPKDEIILSAPPEPPRTTQIREEIELICKAVSASELFKLCRTHATSIR